MGFCTQREYTRFMGQVNDLEKMLIEDGIILVKFWFSIDLVQQKARIEKRLQSPLMQWKVSSVDLALRKDEKILAAIKELCLNQRIQSFVPGL